VNTAMNLRLRKGGVILDQLQVLAIGFFGDVFVLYKPVKV
jgi:hypothetical protein